MYKNHMLEKSFQEFVDVKLLVSCYSYVCSLILDLVVNNMIHIIVLNYMHTCSKTCQKSHYACSPQG